MFGKRIKEQESRVKIKLEGEKEYIEAVQRMNNETKMLYEITQMINEALERQIGIVHKLREQERDEKKGREEEEKKEEKKSEVAKMDSEKEVREKFLEFVESLIMKANALSTEEMKNNESIVSFALRAGEFICGLNYCYPFSD